MMPFGDAFISEAEFSRSSWGVFILSLIFVYIIDGLVVA